MKLVAGINWLHCEVTDTQVKPEQRIPNKYAAPPCSTRHLERWGKKGAAARLSCAHSVPI
jgi:hypothetical protein